APSAPQAPTAAAGLRPGDIEVRWAAPADDGGTAITGYGVWRGTTADNAVRVATLGNALTWTDSDRSGGVEYWYRVTAWNAVGEGARSEADAGSAIGPLDVKVKTTPTATVYRDGDDDNVVDPGEAVVALP
ncbi:MAG TPA: fibronectin type III domain-containing protein, partial [Candidatus Thermoplasmatota archaeon]|nr:fibronectin type III domain-containing protein [Candidatus Thermoplasmatota archaeon]